MNVVGCWFGSMPACHGCGGLAGQYRFGARSGISVVFLGTAKLIVGLLLGGTLVQILLHFPVALLGVLLLFAGLELAMACRDQNTRTDAFIMLVVTAVSITDDNAAVGFVCGMVVAILLKAREKQTYEKQTYEMLWKWRPWGRRRNAIPGPDTHQV
jgi:MFS superfamily sulfate permease-like transporter